VLASVEQRVAAAVDRALAAEDGRLEALVAPVGPRRRLGSRVVPADVKAEREQNRELLAKLRANGTTLERRDGRDYVVIRLPDEPLPSRRRAPALAAAASPHPRASVPIGGRGRADPSGTSGRPAAGGGLALDEIAVGCRRDLVEQILSEEIRLGRVELLDRRYRLAAGSLAPETAAALAGIDGA
jgi:hypothetical protein